MIQTKDIVDNICISDITVDTDRDGNSVIEISFGKLRLTMFTKPEDARRLAVALLKAGGTNHYIKTKMYGLIMRASDIPRNGPFSVIDQRTFKPREVDFE